MRIKTITKLTLEVRVIPQKRAFSTFWIQEEQNCLDICNETVVIVHGKILYDSQVDDQNCKLSLS